MGKIKAKDRKLQAKMNAKKGRTGKFCHKKNCQCNKFTAPICQQKQYGQ